jgi:outer membrane protein assembly factor BamB
MRALPSRERVRLRSRRLLGVASVLTLLAASLVMSATPFASDAASAPLSTEWLGYHGGADGAGTAVGIKGFDTAAPKWTSPVLDGQVYGEPLVYRDEVIVATENNSLYALSSANGHVLWHKHLATAVPSNLLPCGDISPEVGITGTPVIDPSRREVFALVFALNAGKPVHYMYGLGLTSGALMLREALRTPTPDQSPYLNRSGLALSHGAVIYTFGGNYGDCATYHGVVGALSESAPSRAVTYVVDSAPGEREGAVWMGGAAPAVDAAGNVWVTSGNGSLTSAGQPYDHSDAVLEFTPSMKLKGFFAPPNWYQDNAADGDLSSEPALMGNGLVVATGKSGHIYLLNATHLGGVAGQIASIDSHCGDVLDGGVAIHGRIVYLPCMAGTEAVRVTSSPASIKVIWHASAGSGPPIMAGQRVWTIGSDGVLYGLNPDTGVVIQHVSLGEEANHFPTPSVGAGLLLASLARGVVAFAAS